MPAPPGKGNNKGQAFSALSLETPEGYYQRYYVMEAPNQRNMDLMRRRFERVVGALDKTHQVLHWAESPNRPVALIEVAVNDEDHEWMLRQPRTTYIGSRDEETGDPDADVMAYLEANAADWSTPKG